jgi:hypothetical protein
MGKLGSFENVLMDPKVVPTFFGLTALKTRAISLRVALEGSIMTY